MPSQAKKILRTNKRPRLNAALLTPAIFAAICEDVAHGESVRAAVEKLGFQCTQFYRYVWRDTSKRQQYEQAKKTALEVWADELYHASKHPLKSEVKTVKKQRYLPDGRGGVRDLQELKVTEESTQHVDNVPRTRLYVDTVKWALAKQMPRKYGDHVGKEDAGDGQTSVLVIPGTSSIADWERASNEQRVRLAEMAKTLED